MSPQEAQKRLIGLLEATKRARIVVSGDGYVHAEFLSRVFRFVDDVEFVLDPGNGLLHMRSASRAGYYDFGVNRRRLEALARRLREMGFE